MKSLIRVTALLATMALVGCATSSQNSFDQGQQAFKTGDYKTAFQTLYPLALNGQPDAEYAVGYMLYYGKGVMQNQNIGAAWIREAAIHGQSQAEQAMELLTEKGTFNATNPISQ